MLLIPKKVDKIKEYFFHLLSKQVRSIKQTMHKRPLGISPVTITPLVLGTWAIGGWMWGGTEEKDAIAAIRASIEHGITTIDTAAIYGMGLSEELVGKAIKGCRDKVVLATKCGMRWDSEKGIEPWPSQDPRGNDVVIRKNLHPSSIAYECEQSLKRLQVDVIDLYQIHWPDLSTPIEESWGAMVRLLEEGKVRAIGVSNYTLQQLSQAHALYPVHSIQSPYSLIRRGIEDDIVPFCQNNQIAILGYSTLERGLLTGKISLRHQFAKNDHRAQSPTFALTNRKRAKRALDAIRPIAERHGATLAQVILHSTYHMPGITGVLAGARNAHQAIENAKALELRLSQNERIHVVAAFTDAMEDVI
jgi:aryl-alcohol dehydrogenase-like predicted oxidoreductase